MGSACVASRRRVHQPAGRAIAPRPVGLVGNRSQQVGVGAPVDQPDLAARRHAVAQPDTTPVCDDTAAGTRDPVTEPLVDHRLRGPQRRHDLAPGGDVVELAGDQVADDALAAVRRQDADVGHGRVRDPRPAGDGEPSAVGVHAADHRVALESCDVAAIFGDGRGVHDGQVESDHRPQEDLERRLHLVGPGRRPIVDGHVCSPPDQWLQQLLNALGESLSACRAEGSTQESARF